MSHKRDLSKLCRTVAIIVNDMTIALIWNRSHTSYGKDAMKIRAPW